jgi:hypothetical protein
MKVFDNAVNGVLTAVPTPEFFKRIALEYDKYLFLMRPYLLELFQTNPFDWTEYFDVYNKKYSEMFVQFNNWSQLYHMINDNEEIALRRNHYNKKMNSIMKQHWSEVDIEWRRYFKRLLVI